MFDALYRRRLERDLEEWRNRGWVTEEAAGQILDSAGHDGRPRTAIIVGFLGAILIAFGAITFVSANWAEMARPLRLAILVGGMAACYGIAALLAFARQPWFADAAITAGSALFGASIILVAQSYHISGDYPDALLVWGAGSFAAALLGPSRGALVLSLGVLSLWSWYEATEFGWTIHWPYLFAVFVIGTLTCAWGWRPGIHLSILALAGWIIVSAVDAAVEYEWTAAAATLLGCAAALMFLSLGRFLSANPQWPTAAQTGPVFGIYGLIGFLALLIFLQAAIFDGGSPDLDDDRAPLFAAGALIVVAGVLFALTRSGLRGIIVDGAMPLAIVIVALALGLAAARNEAFAESLGIQVLLGVLTLAASVWSVAYGNRIGSRAVVTFGLIAFAGEVLYLYFVTFGTLLDTAVFFLVGGVLLVGLAALLVRLQRRLSARTGEVAA